MATTGAFKVGLDLMAPVAVLGPVAKKFIKGATKKATDKIPTMTDLLKSGGKKVAGGAVKGGAFETPTEVTQEYLDQLQIARNDPTFDINSPEAHPAWNESHLP